MWNISPNTLMIIAAFWLVINALGTIAIFILLFIEIPRIREGARRQGVGGMQLAIQALEKQQFKSSYDMLLRTWQEGSGRYPSLIDRQVETVLADLEYVAKLIELGYVDRSRFYYLFGDRLRLLARAMADFERRENSRIPGHRADYPRSFAMLKDVNDFVPQVSVPPLQVQLADQVQIHEDAS